MAEGKDIRWHQRLDNYVRAVSRIGDAVERLRNSNGKDPGLEDMMRDSLIQRFEFTHELAWKLMKDYAEYQGHTGIRGSRDAIRIALQMNLIDDPEWMESVELRNRTSHRYDEEMVMEASGAIIKSYYPLMAKFRSVMQEIQSSENA